MLLAREEGRRETLQSIIRVQRARQRADGAGKNQSQTLRISPEQLKEMELILRWMVAILERTLWMMSLKNIEHKHFLSVACSEFFAAT